MAEPRVLPKAPLRAPGLDWQELNAIGLQRLQRLAGETWTDHNTHDPGITILELLSYALSELSYRASQPVRDLLRQVEFPTAALMLPNEPVTPRDYRRIVIDTPGVRNAWVHPVRTPCFADPASGEVSLQDGGRAGTRRIELGGLYRVLVEIEPELNTDEQRAPIFEAVRRQLHQHRSLCEDFLEIVGIEQQGFLLCAEIELTPGADAAAVHAEVLQRTRDYLDPAVGRLDLSSSRKQILADGSQRSVPRIFEGPLPEHGFVADEELASSELRSDIRLSDVINLLMDIDGVVAIRDAIMSPEPKADNHAAPPSTGRWVIKVEGGKVPRLNAAASRIVYYKRGLPLALLRTEAAPVSTRPVVAGPEDLPVPAGRNRDLAAYHSFQHHFPALYGLSELPAPDELSPLDERHRRQNVLRLQLKSFLLFFDQVMANFCAQLASVHELFSISADAQRTYFSQVVTGLPGIEAAYTDPSRTGLQLNRLAENDEVRSDRRNRFLDHRIAMVGERFHDYAAIMRSAFGATTDSLIADKCDFLASCAAIGAERGRGYDYRRTDAAGLWDSSNVSGFERRIAGLLGISSPVRRSLTATPSGPEAQITGTGDGPFRFAISVSGSSVLTGTDKFATRPEAEERLQLALELGQWSSTYSRESLDEGYRFTISTPKGEPVVRSRVFATPEETERRILETRTFLRRHYSREGVFVIENILLRPERDEDPSLHFCVDRDCEDCGGDDPYSFRVHVILPADAGRFNDMDFRGYVETVIREELPAHVFPRICWVGQESLAEVEAAYRDWLEVRAGLADSDRTARMKRLIDALTGAKSIYPHARLTSCDTREPKARFVLSRTALGSKSEND